MPIGVVLVNSSNLDKRCQWRKNEVAMNLFVGAVSNESKYFGNSIKSCTLCTKMSCCFPTISVSVAKILFSLMNSGISYYINIIYIFMKLSAVSETTFHYQDKIPPSDYVVNIASNMQVSERFYLYKVSLQHL